MRYLMQCLSSKCRRNWKSHPGKIPVECPQCRSRKLKVAGTLEDVKYHCQRCDNDWDGQDKKPVACPRCHSPYWDKPRKEPTIQ